MILETIRWCVSNKPGCNLPEWARTAGLDSDGEVYIPVEIAFYQLPESEAYTMLTLLAAAQDGIPIVYDEGHPFLPASWMATEFPREIEGINLVRRKVYQHFGYTAKESPQ